MDASWSPATTPLPHGDGKGDVTVDAGGSLCLYGHSAVVNGLWGDGTVTTATQDPGTLTVGDDDATSQFDGVIMNVNGSSPTGDLSLIKIGSGTLTLGGVNTYTGGTTVSGGTLNIASGGSILGRLTLNGGQLTGDVLSAFDATSPVVQGNNVTLTATATNADSVSFFRDANANGVYDAGVDELLGMDTNGADGWSTVHSTSGWSLGNAIVFAVADYDGAACWMVDTTTIT